MNPNGVVVAPDQGPVWSMEPGRKSVLKLQNDDTEKSVMMFEETAPVGTVTPMHLHHDSDEVAYVLSGEITFKIGDRITVGGPGTSAFMPRDVPHAWKSGVIKAASLHLNAVLDNACFQEYCVAETPINRLLTRERMPVEKGFVAVPIAPGLGITLDSDVLERYAVGRKPLPIA